MWRLAFLGLSLTSLACSLRGTGDLQSVAATTAATGGAAGATSGTGGCGAHAADCDGQAGCETDVDGDPKNCGACGHDCEGGECVTGRCQPMVLSRTPMDKGFPTTVAFGGGNVYFADGDRTIYAAPASETMETAPAIVSIDNTLVWDMAVDAPNDRLYWASNSGANSSALPTGVPEPLRAGTAFSVALRGAVRYFLMSDGIWLSPADFLIGASVTHGSIDVTSAGLPAFCDTASTIDPSGPLFDCATPGLGTVYFVDSALIIQEIAALQTCVVALTVDASSVYWTDSGDGSVWRAPLEVQPQKLRLDPQPQQQPVGIAVDAERVYWVSTGMMPKTGELWSVKKDGSAPELLADGLPSPLSLVIDTSTARLFFTSGDADERTVMKLVLPPTQ